MGASRMTDEPLKGRATPADTADMNTDTPPTDLDELRRLAVAASLGYDRGDVVPMPCWQVLSTDTGTYVAANGDPMHTVARIVDQRGTERTYLARAQYVAAVDPASVLRLLDYVAELEAELHRRNHWPVLRTDT